MHILRGEISSALGQSRHCNETALPETEIVKLSSMLLNTPSTGAQLYVEKDLNASRMVPCIFSQPYYQGLRPRTPF